MLIAYGDHVAVIVWNGEVFMIFNKLYLISICYYC